MSEYDPDWSVKAAEAALDAFDAKACLDLERDKGPSLAMWHLFVCLHELAARKGIDLDKEFKDATREFLDMVDNGTITIPAPTAPVP